MLCTQTISQTHLFVNFSISNKDIRKEYEGEDNHWRWGQPCYEHHSHVASPSNVSQASNHKDEPQCKYPELLMGYSPTLIGDTPPSKRTSIRSQKPTLVMERVGSNAHPRIMTAQHPPLMVHPSSLATTGFSSSRLLQHTKSVPRVVVPTQGQAQATKNLSSGMSLKNRSKDKNSSQYAKRTPEESEEDNGGSLADFIVDDEVDEDEYSDVTDKGAVIPGNDAEDILAGSGDQDVEDLKLNISFPHQGQDVNEDPHILASDSKDEHLATSVALHQKKCKGKGRIIEDVGEDEDEYGKISEARKEKKTSTPPPPVCFTPAMKRVLPSQNTNHLTSQDEVEVDSEMELPIRKAVYHYIEMDKAIKLWRQDKPQICAVLKTKTPGPGKLYHDTPKFHHAAHAELKCALKLFTWADLQDMSYDIKYIKNAYLKNPVLGKNLFLLSQCAPSYFASQASNRSRGVYLTIKGSVDSGPICCVIAGIVQECQLMGDHMATFQNTEHHRKQIILSPLLDDFLRQAALINVIFGRGQMLFNTWNFGLTFGMSMVPDAPINAYIDPVILLSPKQIWLWLYWDII
ncbi:hypothetical protein K439DRAFT_1622842 [Ramaria rubella]|nr:hypothetical protein K439DRAFT_1622842 [Ramaria rubella]